LRHIRTTLLIALLSVVLSAILVVRFSIPGGTVFSVSAVETPAEIEVYRDARCTVRVNSIDWGNLSLGQNKTVEVYVRNAGNESLFLDVRTANWNPQIASRYLVFSWSCQNASFEPGDVAKVTQHLFVSTSTSGISSFSFDIIFEKRRFILSDVNDDGVVNMRDIGIVCAAFGSTPGDSHWNADADLNGDGRIDMRDIGIVTANFGKRSQH
jgi:hypothetical protein